jgi:hypothetical protein
MNSKKKNIQKTSGTRKDVIKVAYSGKYKPGQLITICKNVFRIAKNKSGFTDCYMCDLNLHEQKDWCKYCLHNLHWCYFKLIKKH